MLVEFNVCTYNHTIIHNQSAFAELYIKSLQTTNQSTRKAISYEACRNIIWLIYMSILIIIDGR